METQIEVVRLPAQCFPPRVRGVIGPGSGPYRAYGSDGPVRPRRGTVRAVWTQRAHRVDESDVTIRRPDRYGYDVQLQRLRGGAIRRGEQHSPRATPVGGAGSREPGGAPVVHGESGRQWSHRDAVDWH